MKANCAICGREFEKTKNIQVYCSEECQRIGKNVKEQERYLKNKAENEKALELVQKPKPMAPRPKTDWKAIGRLMEETGKTYGKLVAEGRI